ncbi:MAG: glutathione S-transferase family protein [Thiohalocapsa sp.]|nr:glutathione S-transferase family protein [Thiohalocapsa sp.]
MGLFGKTKNKQPATQLRGYPADPGTNQCLLMAAERGIALDTMLVDVGERACDSPEYRALSPFGKVPCLRDGDFVVSGAPAVLAYLDVKGAGASLSPKKASILGEQNYWIDLGQRLARPAVMTLVGPLLPGAAPVADPDLDAARSALSGALALLDTAMADGRTFIVGQYSLADVHWTAYVHLCLMSGEQGLLDPHAELAAWLKRIQSRKSASGRSTYEALATLDEIRNKRLKSVA